MEDFHPFLHPIWFDLIDINHIIIIGDVRTFDRKIEVDFTKKSAKLTKTGGVMNTNILTKIVTACLCMWSLGLAAEKTFVPVDQKADQTVEQTNKASYLK